MNAILGFQIAIGVIIFIMFILFIIYLYLLKPKKRKIEEETTIFYSEPEDDDEKEKKKTENYGRFQGELTEESIFEFMEFDEIIDNMIVRKNRKQYVMIMQCNGINYDLMSEDEKLSVEQGFVQFLNTLRFPIQLYVQTRTLNLHEIIEGYKERERNLSNDIEKVMMKLNQAKRNNDIVARDKLEFERRRKQNMLEYANDITDYVDKLNSNRNILQQKTYVVISLFISELGGNLENYSKDEISDMCFSELYTRCQNIASSLASSQVTIRILDSEELAELLYIAYNRDESEIYRLSQALDAEYDALYSTSKDVLQKKQEKLDKEINIAAIDLATDSILRADKKKRIEDLERERTKKEKIKEKANEFISNYENQLNSRVYEIAKENVEKYGEKEKTPAKKSSSKTTKKTSTATKTKTKSKTKTDKETKTEATSEKKNVVRKKAVGD